MANKVTITVQGQGAPTQADINPGDTHIGDVVDINGRTVYLSRNGALINGVTADTTLLAGDDIIIVGNKQVGVGV